MQALRPHPTNTGQARRAVNFQIQVLVWMFTCLTPLVFEWCLSRSAFQTRSFLFISPWNLLALQQRHKGKLWLSVMGLQHEAVPPRWYSCKCKRELYNTTEQEFDPNAALPWRHLASVRGTTLETEGKVRISCSCWIFIIMLQEQEVLHPWPWV